MALSRGLKRVFTASVHPFKGSFSGTVIYSRRMASNNTAAPLLLSPQELENISASKKDVVALDVSWFMPNSPRNPNEEFEQKRLPVNARRFDLDEVASSHPLGLKHMMPSASQFAGACEKLGISPSTHVVLYDTQGVFSSPRALFTFRAFGHQNSSVLDGGLPRWEAEGLSLVTSASDNSIAVTSYPEPSLDESVLRSYEQVVANAELDPSSSSSSAVELVLDARSAGRFTGQDPEPRPGLSSGHIPHSFSLPFTAFLQTHTTGAQSSYTTFRHPDEVLQALTASLGAERVQEVLSGRRRIVASCGSGMTAGVLWLGLQLLGVRSAAIYDESWTGYAARETSKIVKDV
ncbi:thiosulfate sulfurtransferase [Schizopora paradoxa]|uniref:Thiosulfate sulfurtransferase n=1 Tax=Schizopora paradoxa TaxID=27342 RepID=A0A0H2S826_9AGAM|nr:thiosulfate sulfurtransferase [Schizopora paradoxa]